MLPSLFFYTYNVKISFLFQDEESGVSIKKNIFCTKLSYKKKFEREYPIHFETMNILIVTTDDPSKLYLPRAL